MGWKSVWEVLGLAGLGGLGEGRRPKEVWGEGGLGEEAETEGWEGLRTGRLWLRAGGRLTGRACCGKQRDQAKQLQQLR